MSTLVLVRHGHRDNMDRALDNGLTEKGQKQAKRIADYAKSRFNKEDILLLSSAKKRCQETLEPTAKILKSKVHVEDLLYERKSDETEKDFQKRILSFFKKWKSLDVETCIACSHGDWIPYALYLLFGIETDVQKGSWTELHSDDSSETGLKLHQVIQSFKDFD